MIEVKYLTPNVVNYIRHPTVGGKICWMLDAGYWMLDARWWVGIGIRDSG
jgi:hypothetical protein